MAYVDELIESFVQEMKDDLASMSQEDFHDLVKYLLYRSVVICLIMTKNC